MSKKIFALVLVGVLAGILFTNIVQEASVKKKEAELQASFLTNKAVESASDDAKMVQANQIGLSNGDTAFDFTLKDLEGNDVKLSDFQGKKVFLNFWATWCPPCKAEMPHMQNFYESKANEMNVEILAVNLTKEDKGIEKVKKFAEDYKITFPILLDEKGHIGKKYRSFAIPTTYVLNTEGKIEQKIVGPMNEEMMIRLMENVD
ncbi:peroxiredoxin family protein [Bacillus chungangensis]|uniref:Peroxiredoxin n=1 Tax=Bacillus chungangensis TaxID=587633 RepID=A0ABT9WVC4_9BACI|nr:TlpA disulfide reductase family protein [Bacillus chungangensis]MDQ0177064.1 peroxiredoxin [Bacillus chungangensis]